jgi:hypothetical protein
MFNFHQCNGASSKQLFNEEQLQSPLLKLYNISTNNLLQSFLTVWLYVRAVPEPFHVFSDRVKSRSIYFFYML